MQCIARKHWDAPPPIPSEGPRVREWHSLTRGPLAGSTIPMATAGHARERWPPEAVWLKLLVSSWGGRALCRRESACRRFPAFAKVPPAEPDPSTLDACRRAVAGLAELWVVMLLDSMSLTD